MNKKSWYRKPEMIVAFSAVLISLCALFATIFQAYLERQSQYLSVWPRLELRVKTGDEFEYSVGNKGIGPAIVKSLAVSVDGEPVKNWFSLMQAIAGDDPHISQTQSVQGSVIPAGEEIVMFQTDDRKQALKLKQGLDRITIEVCYCSVFEECWSIDSGDSFIESPSCPVGRNNSFVE